MNEHIEGKTLDISIKAEAQYVLEFPVFIAIIIRNGTTDTDYYDLPKLGILSPIDSIAVNIMHADGRPEVRLGPSFVFRDEQLFRAELLAGETTRTLIDLSWFGQNLNPGKYQITITLFAGPDNTHTSFPVMVEFIEPTPGELSEAKRLRSLGLKLQQTDYGSWEPFFIKNKTLVSVSDSIGQQAVRQLALYLLLNKAAHSPDSLALFPIDDFNKDWGDIFSAEVATYEYEISLIRGNRSEIDAIRSKILMSWPDMSNQLDHIDKGEGTLNKIRKNYGVERAP